MDAPPARVARRDVLLAAVLVAFVVVGGTELGAVPPLRAINAVIGAAFVLQWIRLLPRNGDRTDGLVLAALLVYLVACVLSAFPRAAFDAAVDGMAFAAVFSVTRWELRRSSARLALLVALGIAGAIVALVVITAWSGTWRTWIADVGIIPPLDARLNPGPYRHPHVVAMLLALLAPALVWLATRWSARPIWAVGLLLSLAVVVMAGGRGVWAAVAVAAVLAVTTTRVRSPRVVGAVAAAGAALVVVVVVSGLAGPLLQRLGATSTLALRGAYWGETLQQWGERPLQGWGPGSFSTFITLGDYFDAQAFVPRHADNAVIQLLGEAGVLGIVVLGLLAAAVWMGVRGSSGGSRIGLLGVVLFALLSMTDNPSDTPNLMVVGAAWAAIATTAPGPAGRAATSHARPLRVISVAAAGVVAVAVGSTIAAATAYDQARGAAERPNEAYEALQISAGLDPGHALYRRSLGLAAWWSGEIDRALAELETAAGQNPADATTLRALTILRFETGDVAGAEEAAEMAVERRRSDPTNLLLLSGVASSTGDDERAHETLTEALAYEPWLARSWTWSEAELRTRVVPALESAYPRSEELASEAATWRPSAAWIAGLQGRQRTDDGSPAALLHWTIACQLDVARTRLEADFTLAAESDAGNLAALLLSRLEEDEALFERAATIAALRSAPAAQALSDPQVESPLADAGEDRRLYGTTGMPPPALAEPLPARGEALSVWLANPAAAARAAAPDSSLAEGC